MKKIYKMKKIYSLFFLLLSFIAVCQEDTEFEQMVEAEMKSASSTMNVEINPNTQNYDITYHQLKFTVDPAVYSIVGEVTTTFTAVTNMTTVTFDMANALVASSVTMNGNPLTFTQNTIKK